MGKTCENATELKHKNGGVTPDFHLYAHREDLGIDTHCPTKYDLTQRAGLVSASAQSQAAYDTAAGTLMGTWYTGLSAAFKTAFREIHAE